MKKNLNIKRKNKNNKLPVSKVWSLSNPMPRSALWVPEDQIHRFVYNLETVAFTSSSVTVPTYTNTAYALNLFGNYTDVTTLFDQYRIVEAEWWIIPRTAYSGSSTVNYGMLTSCVDYDDNNNLGSIAEGVGHTNSVTTSGNQGHYHKFKPRLALAAYSGAFTSYANQSDDMWIDCNSAGVYYYGVKTVLTATDSVYVYDLMMKATIEFRNKRR